MTTPTAEATGARSTRAQRLTTATLVLLVALAGAQAWHGHVLGQRLQEVSTASGTAQGTLDAFGRAVLDRMQRLEWRLETVAPGRT